MDPSVLTPLIGCPPEESKEKHLSRITSFLPLPRSGKMDTQQGQEIAVGKANAKKTNANSPSQLLDKPLYHDLTEI